MGKVANGGTGLKKGDAITGEYLDGLKKDDWFAIRMKDEDAGVKLTIDIYAYDHGGYWIVHAGQGWVTPETGLEASNDLNWLLGELNKKAVAKSRRKAKKATALRAKRARQRRAA